MLIDHIFILRMELPEELLVEILVRLPVKSLLRSKCVCKHWLSLIQSPQFVEHQLHFSETSSSKILCFRKDPITETHVISVHDRLTLDKIEDLEWPPFLAEEGVDDSETSLRRIKIFGPVNGIYCIHRSLIDEWVGTLVLWNPSTREYKHIHPEVSFPFPRCLLGFGHGGYYQQNPETLSIGFGFDHTTNDYKVVVICQWEDFNTRDDQRWHLRVYNHASDSWRTVYYLNRFDDPHPQFEGGDPPFPLMMGHPPISDCLLNGVFHWACDMIYPGDWCFRVLAFDMATDALLLMKGPPLPTDCGLCWNVWVLKETVVAASYILRSSNDPLKDLEVWMMMEYGVDDSWAMIFKFQGVNEWTPAGLPYDDRIFFDDQNGQLISTDVDDDHQIRKHDVYGMKLSTCYGICGTLGVLSYIETLTTLKPV